MYIVTNPFISPPRLGLLGISNRQEVVGSYRLVLGLPSTICMEMSLSRSQTYSIEREWRCQLFFGNSSFGFSKYHHFRLDLDLDHVWPPPADISLVKIPMHPKWSHIACLIFRSLSISLFEICGTYERPFGANCDMLPLRIEHTVSSDQIGPQIWGTWGY